MVYSEITYRKIASDRIFAECQISHTTLYRWISGLGEKILDRTSVLVKEYPPSFSSILAETEKVIVGTIVQRYTEIQVTIPQKKYRSERRKDQLVAVFKVLVLISYLCMEQTIGGFQQWNQKLHVHFKVLVWDFPSSIHDTPIQQIEPP